MTFVVKTRGSPGYTVAEYICPHHGRFEVVVSRDEQGDPPAEQPCSLPIDPPGGNVIGEAMHSKAFRSRRSDEPWVCGSASPWAISAPLGRMKLASATQGKVAEAPHHLSLDTRELGEGMPMAEWKKKRAKLWNEERWKRVKGQL